MKRSGLHSKQIEIDGPLNKRQIEALIINVLQMAEDQVNEIIRDSASQRIAISKVYLMWYNRINFDPAPPTDDPALPYNPDGKIGVVATFAEGSEV